MKDRVTFASTTFQRSPRRAARTSHISFLQARYSWASNSSFRLSQSSTCRRSIKRSWRLRHALAVLLGKCLLAIGCQLSPDARARRRISSSDVVQIAAFRCVLVPKACGYGAVVDATEKEVEALGSLGMIGSSLNEGMYTSLDCFAVREWKS